MSDINEIDVDFKVHDGYVAFSSEIVRLALLSPAVFAFFIAFAGKDPSIEAYAQLLAPAKYHLCISLVFMALAVAFGLVHRYCAIDFMSTLVEKQRKGGRMRGDWRFRASSFSIWLAPASLLLGACFLFVAIFNILGSH